MASKTSGKRKWTKEKIRQWYQDTGAFTYANPEDLNIVVKKPRSEGLTVNWANPRAYLLLGAILAVVFAVVCIGILLSGIFRKPLQLVCGFDREIGIGTQYIRDLLPRYLAGR